MEGNAIDGIPVRVLRIVKSYRLPSFENEFHSTPFVSFLIDCPPWNIEAVSIVGKSSTLSRRHRGTGKGLGNGTPAAGGPLGGRSSIGLNLQYLTVCGTK